jgi:riboflavin biosynthesis pyrimidine reductase
MDEVTGVASQRSKPGSWPALAGGPKTGNMNPLQRLYERDDLATFGTPPALISLYGGEFGLARPGLYANFVLSTDGVVAVPGNVESGRVISGENEPDHFVMGLLRAAADAVLIGAGTFRRAAGDLWQPRAVYPAAGQDFRELRRRLGLRPQPLLVLVTASGRIDATQPALCDSLIITTPLGEGRLRGALPEGARIAVLDSPRFAGAALLDVLRDEGLEVILTEGGPTLVTQLLEANLVDELFLTTAPRLFGRTLTDGRKSLVEGIDLQGLPLELLSLRRHESYLFARYRVRGRAS